MGICSLSGIVGGEGAFRVVIGGCRRHGDRRAGRRGNDGDGRTGRQANGEIGGRGGWRAEGWKDGGGSRETRGPNESQVC